MSGKQATLSFWAKGSHLPGEDNRVYVGLKQDFGTNISRRLPITGNAITSDAGNDDIVMDSFIGCQLKITASCDCNGQLCNAECIERVEWVVPGCFMCDGVSPIAVIIKIFCLY